MGVELPENEDFAGWRKLGSELGPDQKAANLVKQLEAFNSADGPGRIAIPVRASRLRDELCRALDAESPLADVPYMLQDVFDIAAMPTRCGAGFADPFEYEAEQSCLLNHKLELAGAIFAGKLQSTEFGLSLGGEGPCLPVAKHPEPPHQQIIGGASSCALAVAQNLVPVTFGLDTLGGVRTSAAHAGLHAFRMAPNQLSTEGVFPCVPSLESVGWITKTAANSIELYRALCLNPALQERLSAWEEALEDGTAEKPRGLFLDNLVEPTSPRLKRAVYEQFRGFELDSPPKLVQALRKTFRASRQQLRIIASRELYAIHRHWLAEYRNQYSNFLARFIQNGAGVSLDQVERAEAFRFSLRHSLADLFRKFDFIVSPIISKVSIQAGQMHPERITDIETNLAPVSLAGMASAVLPFTFDDGFHSGVQVLFNPAKPLLPVQLLQILRSSQTQAAASEEEASSEVVGTGQGSPSE